MKELEKFVTVKEHTSENTELLFVDFDEKSTTPKSIYKKLSLTKTDNSKVKELLIEQIVKLSSTNTEMIEKLSLVDKLKEYNTTELRIAKAKVLNASNYIATYGRIGTANTILISKENYDKLELSEITEGYETFFDDSIDDIYIYRRNSIDQPVLILITFEDKYDFAGIGFYPERQFMKISLI